MTVLKLLVSRLNMKTLIKIVTDGLLDKLTGRVFEGKKQFDLVGRLIKNSERISLNLENVAVFCSIPTGGSIPLSELANHLPNKRACKNLPRKYAHVEFVIGVNVSKSKMYKSG